MENKMRHTDLECVIDEHLNPRIHIGKSDGLVSIQASHTHYCTPREDCGPYTAMELGFPTIVPPDYILEYAEDGSDPLNTVYGYVPVELIRKWFDEAS